MKEITIGLGITVPAFETETSDPLYWLSLAAYEDVVFAERCYVDGVKASFMESSDVEDAEAVFDGLSTGLRAWLDTAIGQAIAGQTITPLDDNYIPELLELLALIVTGQYGLIFALFVKVGLKFVIDWLTRKLPQDSSLDETAQTLDTIFLDRDSDPEVVRNRLDELKQLVLINIARDTVDSTDFELLDEGVVI